MMKMQITTKVTFGVEIRVGVRRNVKRQVFMLQQARQSVVLTSVPAVHDWHAGIRTACHVDCRR